MSRRWAGVVRVASGTARDRARGTGRAADPGGPRDASADRDLRDDQRALAGVAVDRQPAAERGTAILKAGDPGPPRRVGPADAVVAHLDPQRRRGAVRGDAQVARG